MTGEETGLALQFEANRDRLKRLAYRMLGSLAEAEDAVQESWLRLMGVDGVENPAAWLTTVVARICLDRLRKGKARREQRLNEVKSETIPSPQADPEQEALLADSVGMALLVVLQKLEPPERVAFVLHDMFALPFDEIATIVGRSPEAARQLASRARRRVQGGTPANPDLAMRRRVVDAFLAASRKGDLAALLKVLDPDVVFTADPAAARMGGPKELRGSEGVARLFAGRAQGARSVLVDGGVGVVVAPAGRLLLAMEVTVTSGRIAAIGVFADKDRLAAMDFTLLPEELG